MRASMPCGKRNRTARTAVPKNSWRSCCAPAASGSRCSGRRGTQGRCSWPSPCRGCRPASRPCQRRPHRPAAWGPGAWSRSPDTGGTGWNNQNCPRRGRPCGRQALRPLPAAARHRSSGSGPRCAGCARRRQGRCTARIPDTGTSIRIRRHELGCGCSGPVFHNNPGGTVRRSRGRRRYRPAASAACRSPRRGSHNILA